MNVFKHIAYFIKCSTMWTVLILLCFSASQVTSSAADLSEGAPCALRQFRCANGRCIPFSWLCEGENDCGDGSDESPQECQKSKTCSSHEFRCNNGRCIPIHWQCDIEKDCSDGSDEDPRICQPRDCLTSQFKCSLEICIPQAWVCDNQKDCLDGSDENDCDEKVCGPDEFTCRGVPGECVPLTWMCDDNPDCSDGSDEKACNETCRSDEFTCNNGKCIQKRWQCDRDDDCGDNSDERNCPETVCAEDIEFACSDNHCITAKWRCDGDYDCPDGSDEHNCPSRPVISHCLSKEFECGDRITCIHQSWVCDGDRDCPDGADEQLSLCRNMSCRADQFQCADRSCIAGHLHCSGAFDCPDHSDEMNCTAPVATFDKRTQFDCGGGMYIPLEKVCDNKQDCPEWKDEPRDKCNVNECLINNGNCSQRCVDTPAGFYCDCNPGYKLVGLQKCEDINECELPGSCSQDCTNEIGTFKCECRVGYMRDPHDHTRCKAVEGHASLLFARRHDIRKISLDHHEMTSIVNDTKWATALDFVFRTGMIYWSDVSDQKIYKAPIDEGSERVVVIGSELTTSDGLAVDWIYNHIYWTDTAKNTIELANFEGGMHKVLVRDSLEEPRAIALNPIDGWMYWTDWGKDPKIERAGMDGSHRQTIVSYEVKWPNGLTLDLVHRRVYWVDAKLNTISSCNYDGTGRRMILYAPETLKHPFSITTFEDWVYWTDWDNAAIYKANKFTGQQVEAVTATRSLQNPMVIHVYHPYRQPDGENYCQAVNGHCSHLCLPAPQINEHSPKISCACPEGLRLLSDGLMCVQDVNTADRDNRTKTTTPFSVTTLHSSSMLPGMVPGDKTGLSNNTMYIPPENDTGMIAGIVIAIVTLVLIFATMVAFLIYRHYLHRNVTSMNFDNPVYRKTTEDQFSLEKNAYQQPNRLYPSTVGEEANEPLTSPCTNDFV